MTNNLVNIYSQQPVPPRATVNASAVARAKASADPRANVKQYDRAGLSRGRGQRHAAGISAAQNFAQGIAGAYDDQLRQKTANADALMQMQRGREEYGQALGALQSQAAYAGQMDALQRQGVLYGLLGDLMR